jgi:hypothetical protein
MCVFGSGVRAIRAFRKTSSTIFIEIPLSFIRFCEWAVKTKLSESTATRLMCASSWFVDNLKSEGAERPDLFVVTVSL